VFVCWVVLPCSAVVGYQHSEVHAASIFTLNMEAAWTYVKEVSYHSTTPCHNPDDFNLKHHHWGSLETRSFTSD